MTYARPSSGPVSVVIIDADAGQRRVLAGLIAERADGRFVASGYATAAEMRAAIGVAADAIVIADLETIGGLEQLREMAAARPLIATSANGSLTTAIAAVKRGAADFLPKPIGARALIERLEAAIGGGGQPQAATAEATSRAPTATDFAGFIGRSAPMLAVYDQLKRMAPSRAAVFITGESGTGKELCAEAIHQFAGPSGRPFVAINCSAIPRELIESEIFGHVRGAFTGASDHRAGAAELADGGTLFLDEIAEMDLGLQSKLLRFLQSGTIRRVGGSELKRVNVRVVCATNRDPFVEVAAGRFRSDLFYRLHVLPIHLAPLRERRDDIVPLAEAFLARYAGEEGRHFEAFEPAAVERLVAYDWPGNVRQLANVIRRIVVLDDGTLVRAAMLPAAIVGAAASVGAESAAGEPPPRVEPLWKQERRIIEDALAACGGNIARAAAALEVSPSTIYRKRQSWPGHSGLAA
ncbi:MAG: sigma-54 dependent transcriptional regulator [Bauldia sp.]